MRAHYLDNGEAIAPSELATHGVLYRALPLDAQAYQPVLDGIKREHRYIEQDIVELRPDTPNLEEICAKFDDEHLHQEDEVRFVLEGEGVFDIRSNDDRWMRVMVEAGDLIVVPEGRYHRFELTDENTIICVRLFKDKSGWVPSYR